MPMACKMVLELDFAGFWGLIMGMVGGLSHAHALDLSHAQAQNHLTSALSVLREQGT